MSSSDRTRAVAAKPKATTKPKIATKPKVVAKKAADANKVVVKKIPAAQPPVAQNEASREALALAGAIEAALRNGDLAVISPEAQQSLVAALAKLYGANSEAGNMYPIVGRGRNAVTSTDVMVACAALLKSANLQVFELGMWQSWTGR